ncbi:acyltransferase family protein [uncultured Pontibacter sp.]|uniref:acyltransferase family protein n=1 Tax=uncultured Pontibacter sp. TaxID=453356 RepID=UPI002601DFD8|nr:acyltransferase family protein [uncultured Pontibacter sp.]
MKKHFLQIDILKCAAIVAVIALHSLTKTELVSTYAIYHIWQAVPVFMILMGINLGLGLRKENQQVDLLYKRIYFTKKATRIVFPFLLIFIVSVILGLLWQQLYQRDVLRFSTFTWVGVLPVSGKGNYFITLLLQSIFILPLVGYCFYKRPVLTTLALIFLEVFFLVICKHYELVQTDDAEYLYSAALPRYFSAFAFGLWLAKAIKQQMKFTTLFAFAVPAALSITYLYFIIYGSLHLPFIYESWDMQNVLSFGYAALLILVTVYFLPASSGNSILKSLAEIGSASYHIFLVQVLYFGLVKNHSNLALNLAICLVLGYVFYKLETKLSTKYLKGS